MASGSPAAYSWAHYPDLRHPVVNVIKSLTIHKVFHIQRRQSGQMVALQLAIVIQQTAYGRGIFFPASSPSTSTCHWIPIRRANLINGFQARLGEFNHFHPFSIK